MKVYRIPVDSAARQSGHEFYFQWDLSGFSSARDMKGKTWMAAVEWCDVVQCSEESPIFASNALHPSALFLTCSVLMQHTTWESWSGTPSSTICVMSGYAGTEFYGISTDAPYLRKKTMGRSSKATGSTKRALSVSGSCGMGTTATQPYGRAFPWVPARTGQTSRSPLCFGRSLG